MPKPLTKYKVVNLPYPGRVDLFGIGEVDLHLISDKQADEIHNASVAKKYLVPVTDLPSPEEKPKPLTRKQRRQNLS